jgi:hypothetical protein
MAKTAKKRASLAGWWKGLPFVLVPFAIVFSEAWFRTGILVNYFEIGEITERMRIVQERVQELRAEDSHLRRQSRIDSAAPDIGLVPPEPGQVIVIDLMDNWHVDGAETESPYPFIEERAPIAAYGAVAD